MTMELAIEAHTTNTCRVCQTPVPKRKQLCDSHAPRRNDFGLIEKECFRCKKTFWRRTSGIQRYCSKYCRSEQGTISTLAKFKEVPNTKVCSSCKLDKPAFKFVAAATSRDGLRSRCRDCGRAFLVKWRAKNVDYKDQARSNNLKRKFGISADDYDSLLRFQGGVCFVCKKPPATGKRRLAVDHDHVTGEIRGLLHSSTCNKVLVGSHDVASIRAILAYLENPPARSFFGSPRIATGMVGSDKT